MRTARILATMLTVPLALLLAGPAALAADANAPSLTDDTVLKMPEVNGDATLISAARLSPDGTKLLYARREKAGPQPEGHAGSWPSRVHRMVLRDLKTGGEKVLPVAAWSDDDPPRVMLAMNVFTPDSNLIALGVGVNGVQNGVFTFGHGPDVAAMSMKPGLYDVSADKLRLVDVESQIVVPAFDREGKRLILIAADSDQPPTDIILTPVDKLDSRRVSVGGIPFETCPAADLLPVMTFPDHKQPGSDKMKLKLYDLKAGSVAAADLPLESGSNMDDYPPRWTVDGRYLYYPDYKTIAGAAEGVPNRIQTTRVYDRRESRSAIPVDKAYPVGAGPGCTMVLQGAEGARDVLLHDPVKGTLSPLIKGERNVRAICAGGGWLIYAKNTDGGAMEVHLAKIKLP